MTSCSIPPGRRSRKRRRTDRKDFTTSLNTTNPNTYVKFIFLRTSLFINSNLAGAVLRASACHSKNEKNNHYTRHTLGQWESEKNELAPSGPRTFESQGIRYSNLNAMHGFDIEPHHHGHLRRNSSFSSVLIRTATAGGLRFSFSVKSWLKTGWERGLEWPAFDVVDFLGFSDEEQQFANCCCMWLRWQMHRWYLDAFIWLATSDRQTVVQVEPGKIDSETEKLHLTVTPSLLRVAFPSIWTFFLKTARWWSDLPLSVTRNCCQRAHSQNRMPEEGKCTKQRGGGVSIAYVGWEQRTRRVLSLSMCLIFA